ncbi:unnamed protein product [Toxocara canis]|uniref:Uncharacterized protein n=1 Tax=Toxocara canis TaxID=6265 RepID=A0A183U599_TOXCA|nr:unnamed protein product [Toxocara canis]
MESKIRSTLNEIYFGKTKQIVTELRTTLDAEELKRQKMIANEIKGGITKVRRLKTAYVAQMFCWLSLRANTLVRGEMFLLSRLSTFLPSKIGPFKS